MPARLLNKLLVLKPEHALASGNLWNTLLQKCKVQEQLHRFSQRGTGVPQHSWRGTATAGCSSSHALLLPKAGRCL